MTTDPFDLASRFSGSLESGTNGGRGPERPPRASDEACYVCDACGEEIVVPVDPAAGAAQEYVEDCPVCCRPNLLTVTVDPDGAARCDARPE